MDETQNDAPFVAFYDMHAVTFVMCVCVCEQELPSLLQSYKLRGKQPFVSDFSRLLRHATEKGRGLILYIKKNPGPHGETVYGIRDRKK